MKTTFMKYSIPLLAGAMLLSSCYDFVNPVDPEGDDYQGYKTVDSVAEVTADYPAEGAEVIWCEFKASEVADAGADTYALQVAASSDGFTSPEYEVTDSTSNIFDASDAGLTEGTWYYRVRAHETGGAWGDWSEPVEFTGVSGVDPIVITPQYDNEIVGTEGEVSWSDVDGADEYSFYYLSDQDGTATENLNQASYSFSGLTRGSTITYSIQPLRDGNPNGYWSSPAEISVSMILYQWGFEENNYDFEPSHDDFGNGIGDVWAENPPGFSSYDDDSYEGDWSLRVHGEVENGSSTAHHFDDVVINDPATISFWYKVSSGYAILEFYIGSNHNPDDLEEDWSGKMEDWAYASFDLEPGTHSFVWVYRQDEWNSSDLDTAWIDLVRIEKR